MSVQAVIFDIGGVLAHDVWENAVLGEGENEGLVAKLGLNLEEVRAVGEALWLKYAHLPPANDVHWRSLEKEYWREFIERLSLSSSVDELVAFTNGFIRPVRHMGALLRWLKEEGITLAICSNNTEFWYERQMRMLGLGRYFRPDRVILSSRVGVSKSSTSHAMFSAAVGAVNVDRAECLFVDDRWLNIRRAVEFGLPGILFPSHAEFGAEYLRALLRALGIGEA